MNDGLTIVAVGADYAVVDKPPGLLSVPGRGLADFVAAFLELRNGEEPVPLDHQLFPFLFRFLGAEVKLQAQFVTLLLQIGEKVCKIRHVCLPMHWLSVTIPRRLTRAAGLFLCAMSAGPGPQET